VYAFVIGTESESDELMQTVGKSAHDFLTLPLPAELLKAKIEIARQIVVDQRVLAQSNEVIERYAHHIDRISADRARQLFHAERLSTIGTMSAGLAHEIKNPLGYIATSLETTKIYWQQTSELLTDEKKVLDRVATEKLLSKVPRALERISNGLERIDKLMQGLNNFARSSQGEKQLHNLNDSVTIALEIAEVHLKYHVIVETELSPDLSLVKVDPQQTQQVLINLLINASHALEGEKNGTVTICSFEDSDHVIVTITDNGPGIPDNHLKNIWQPFYTTKAEGKGTGLGLSISQNLIRDNGGTISVRNRAPKGAQFRIEFPKSSSEPISHSLNPKNTDEE
jgi:C4-dicarboxylate-specific signal transduction histidine kinase